MAYLSDTGLVPVERREGRPETDCLFSWDSWNFSGDTLAGASRGGRSERKEGRFPTGTSFFLFWAETVKVVV